MSTRHGRLQTPFFMPIATKGAVKGVLVDNLIDEGAEIILSNTYHLFLRPGTRVIKKAGGLHRFVNWFKPILTDSGGYQIFSLAKFRKITQRGVFFKDNVSGKTHLLTPEKAVQVQIDLGSDIIMALDECPPYPCSKKYAEKSLAITTAWAERSLKYFKKYHQPGQKIFGIIQGSTYKDLRQAHARAMTKMSFDGFAIGGLAVGEPAGKMWEVLKWVLPILPKNKPRYLMGVGYPEQLVKACLLGIDLFDCVVPTRHARHGLLYIYRPKQKISSRKNFYQELKIKQKKYALDLKPLDEACHCLTCRHYSRAYLRHLFMTNEPLALTLATIHNLRFYMRLIKKIRG